MTANNQTQTVKNSAKTAAFIHKVKQCIVAGVSAGVVMVIGGVFLDSADNATGKTAKYFGGLTACSAMLIGGLTLSAANTRRDQQLRDETNHSMINDLSLSLSKVKHRADNAERVAAEALNALRVYQAQDPLNYLESVVQPLNSETQEAFATFSSLLQRRNNAVHEMNCLIRQKQTAFEEAQNTTVLTLSAFIENATSEEQNG